MRACSPPQTCHVSRVTCHVSHVTCHVSCVTCHMSRFTCNIYFFFFGQRCEAYWWSGPTPSSFILERYREGSNVTILVFEMGLGRPKPYGYMKGGNWLLPTSAGQWSLPSLPSLLLLLVTQVTFVTPTGTHSICGKVPELTFSS